MSVYKVGDIVECKVTGIENYGFFVEVDKDHSGLIHISEVSNSFVRAIEDYVSIGEVINAKILSVDEDNHQLKLSIKGINYNNDDNFVDPDGFVNLKKNLDVWMKETLKEIKK